MTIGSAIGQKIGAAIVAPIGWLAAIIDAPLKLWQRATGTTGMAAFFLAQRSFVNGMVSSGLK